MNKAFITYLLFFLNILQIKTGTVTIIDENSPEQKYLNEHYINSYKVPQNLLIYNSKGNSSNLHPLKNAFDLNFNTYWQSFNIEEESFINNIVITFPKTISIDRIVYQAPTFDEIKGNGYPTELKIYYKLKNPDGSYNNEDSNFILFDDIISERTGEKVVFILDEVINCDQIKLEWAEMDNPGNSGYINATASEIILLFPENEYLNKLLFDVFDENDYYKMFINSKYKDLLVIQEIEDNLQDYINNYKFIEFLIERSKKIIDGEIQYDKKREFTTNPNTEINKINQYGNIYSYTKEVLKMNLGGTDRQPTGIAAFEGEKIIVFVDAEETDNLPYIIFYQVRGSYKRSLKKGINFFNENDIKSGGPIYIENIFTSEKQSENVKIYIEGGELFPLFKINDNEKKFNLNLELYISQYNKKNESYLDIAEFYSDKIIITTTATYANEIYNNKGESPQKNLENWDKILKKLYIFDGIQFENDQPYYNAKNEYIKIHIRYTGEEGDKGAFAYYEYIGVLYEDLLPYCLASYNGIGDLIPNEIGNMIDVFFRHYEDKTSGILGEYAVQILYNYYNINNIEILHNEIAPDNIDNLLRNCKEKEVENCNGFFINSGKYSHYIWWAIESFYPGYWGKLDNLIRYDSNLIFGMRQNEAIIFLTSLILGFDMEYYFERFGLGFGDKVFNKSDTTEIYKNQFKKAINESKIKIGINKKLWYADNKQYNFTLNNGEGCYKDDNDYEIKINNIGVSKTSGITLTFEEINCPGHLGFEITENDVVIGFTTKYTFIDKNTYEDDYIPKYKIIAYDRLLDTKESDYTDFENNKNRNLI